MELRPLEEVSWPPRSAGEGLALGVEVGQPRQGHVVGGRDVAEKSHLLLLLVVAFGESDVTTGSDHLQEASMPESKLGIRMLPWSKGDGAPLPHLALVGEQLDGDGGAARRGS